MFKSITFLQKRIKLYLRVNYFLLLLKDIGVMGSVLQTPLPQWTPYLGYFHYIIRDFLNN